ncbi:hypothetical protein ACWY4P_29425 [Streptomyces sp. LZ34]
MFWILLLLLILVVFWFGFTMQILWWVAAATPRPIPRGNDRLYGDHARESIQPICRGQT